MKKVFGLLITLIIAAFMLAYFLQLSKGSDGSAVQSPPGVPPVGTTGTGTPKTKPIGPEDKTVSPADPATTPDEGVPPENPDGTIPDVPPGENPDGTVPDDGTGVEPPVDPTGTGTDTGAETTGTTTTTTGTGTTTGTTIPETGTGTTTGTTGTGTTTTTTGGTGTTPTTGTGTTTGTGPVINKGTNNVTTTTTNSNVLQFDFRNTPLDQVVKYFAGQVNKNFIIPKTLGTSSVTIITGRPLLKDKAFEVLESILLTEQWEMYEDDNFVRIEKQGTPQGKTIPTDVKVYKDLVKEQDELIGNRDRTVTAIVVLQYISAQEIVNILTPMRSPSAVMMAFIRINALFIRDTERNIEYILSIVQKLDQPGTATGKITMVKLQYSVASDIAQTLSMVLSASAMDSIDMGGGPPQPGAVRQPGVRSGAGGNVNIIPDKRTNTLIIIASEKETEALMNLISELDVPPKVGEFTIHTFQCNNQKSEDLAKILSDFVNKRPNVQQPAGTPPIPGAIIQEDFFFIADKVTNTLIIQAPPQDWPIYHEILKNLDQPQRQALIEVWIVEVSSTDDQTLGIEIIPSDAPPNERTGPMQNEIYPVSKPTTSSSALFGGTTTGEDGGTTSAAGAGATIGIRALTATEISIDGRKIRIPNFDTFIRAVKSKSNVKILASPKLVTLNNKEATVNITDQISISTGEITNLDSTGGVVTQNYTRTDVGILLSLTPMINADDFVIMDLNLEISNVVGELTTTPTIAKRTTKSSVRCENQQTIVISGLRRENKTKTKTGVPLLGDIPIIGRAFSTTIQNNINTNLLIFITPHVITDTPEMVAVTDLVKSQRLEDEAKRFEITGKDSKLKKQKKSGVIWNR